MIPDSHNAPSPRGLWTGILTGLLLSVACGCGNTNPIPASPTIPGRDLNQIGLLHLQTGDLVSAASSFEQAYDESRAVDFVEGQAYALYNLALVHRARDEDEEALKGFVRAEQLFRRLENADGTSRSMAARATLLAKSEKLAEARVLLEKALEDSSAKVAGEIYAELSSIHLRSGDLRRARVAAEQAVQSSQRGSVLSDALFNLAQVLVVEEDFVAADAALVKALEIDREIGRRRQLVDTLALLAAVSERLDRTAEAAEYRDRADGVRKSLESQTQDESPEGATSIP